MERLRTGGLLAAFACEPPGVWVAKNGVRLLRLTRAVDGGPVGSVRDVVDYGRIAAHGLEQYTAAERYLKSAAKMRYLARKSIVVNAETSVLSS